MNYLQDRRSSRKKLKRWATFAFIAFLIIYFWSPIFSGFSGAGQAIFRPFILLGRGIGGKFSSLGTYLGSKGRLQSENDQLKADLESMSSRMANYNTVLDENEKLKEILGRKNVAANLVLAAILTKPNQSPYDTLLIDQGENDGIAKDMKVLAYGNVPIGKISEVYNNTSKVMLYSSSGEITQAVISGKDIFIEAVGRGGGNFEVMLPRDLAVEDGTEVTLPGITPRVLGIIQAVVSSPRDAFQKVLMISPVNIFELKFVEVEK